MADPINIRAALDLRPEDAIRAFRQRDELAISVSYRDLEPEEHARAFTAAKVAKLDILEALGGSLDVALRDGQTFAQWRDGILPTLQREGWWGLIQDEALTGTSEPVFVGERRLRTIFATNMRVSRAAGQWARIQAVKAARPFLRYSAVLDNRTRPLHARWHGIIRPVDDPIWQTIYPPNGWNCRCQVQQLSQRDLDRRGWRVTPDGDLPDLGPTGSAWFGLPRQRRDVIRGIDAGWDYNVGAASLRGMARKVVDSIKAAEIRDLDRVAMQTIEEIASDPVMRSALIDELADRATRDTAFNFILPLGRLGQANSADITRLTGLPMDGVIRAIDAQDIRHALKRHGNAKAEDKINQVALTARDFALIDAIVAEPDTVEPLGRLSARKPLRMRYFKRFGGTVYELVEYFAPQLRQWRLKTFLKKVSPR